MKTFRFLDFPVYIQARSFYKEILVVTNELRVYSLKEQLRRAALSITLNVAEGSARESDREFFRFVQLSLGSTNEVVACLDIMHSAKLIETERFRRLQSECEEIAKQLGGLSKKLRNS